MPAYQPSGNIAPRFQRQQQRLEIELAEISTLNLAHTFSIVFLLFVLATTL